MKERADKSTEDAYTDKASILLISYIVKKKSGRRNILRFSTMHDDVSVSKDEYLKRNTICFCDKIKGTVDVVDRKIGKYTTKMKTKMVNEYFYQCT